MLHCLVSVCATQNFLVVFFVMQQRLHTKAEQVAFAALDLHHFLFGSVYSSQMLLGHQCLSLCIFVFEQSLFIRITVETIFIKHLHHPPHLC